MSIKNEKIRVYDMTCTSCEKRIEKTLMNISGVQSVKASFSKQCVDVVYDNDICNTSLLKESVKKIGYSTESSGGYKFIAIVIVAVTIILIDNTNFGFNMQDKLNNATYLALFIIGIFSSIHCVGMCGGIMLSQSLLKEEAKNKLEAMKPAVLYNLGRVISYTILGGLVGALGSVFSLSLTANALLQLFAGAFMIAMGMNMSGFSLFRKINLRIPLSSETLRKKATTPFLVGLLNGLMPCGPLQTIQLYALSTGSPLKGSLSLFMFSLGTVPLMLTFGAISGLISKGYTKKILKLSGVLIIILGFLMSDRGISLLGINVNPIAFLSSKFNIEHKSTPESFTKLQAPTDSSQNNIQTINITADNKGYTPTEIYAPKNTHVKLSIDGKELNSCNNTIVIPSLNIQKQLQAGENIIELDLKDKNINFSCSMGMSKGIIKVTDNTPPKNELVEKETNTSSSKATSIYGNDVTKIPTSRLVNKAIYIQNIQYWIVKGIGHELDPAIVVVDKGIKTRLYFDLNNFDAPESEFIIVSVKNGNKVASFRGKKDTISIDYTFKEEGGYAIFKDKTPIGIVEAVNSLKDANLELIRQKYIK